MWLIENLFVMDQFVMETQRLVDLAKQMNLEGNEVIEFVRAERALAMKRRIRISQEKKEARIAEAVEEDKEERIAAKAEKERIAAIEDDERIAAKADKEKIRRRKKEDEARSPEEAARIRRHKEEEEERIRRHQEMCHLRRGADNIRTRRMLQEVWMDAEERRREEEDEGDCSISVTDKELWRKCFRKQEALASEEAEEIRQHKEYRLQRAYEKLQWEKEDVAKKAEKTAELQQVMVTKTAEEEVIQHEYVVKIAELQHVKVMKTEVEEARQHKDVVNAAEIQHVEVMKTVEDEKMQLEKVMKTAAEDALQLEMVIPYSEASYESEDGGDASEQEASHHPTDDDDEDRSMSEERERNDIGQVRGSSLPAPFVWRTSKMPEDRPRLSSWQDHSRKRSSDESDRRMVGSRHLPLSKKSRFSSWARKKAGGTDVDEDDGSSR